VSKALGRFGASIAFVEAARRAGQTNQIQNLGGDKVMANAKPVKKGKKLLGAVKPLMHQKPLVIVKPLMKIT
jgi:hypothetical protein